jgi:hypothetical protein
MWSLYSFNRPKTIKICRLQCAKAKPHIKQTIPVNPAKTKGISSDVCIYTKREPNVNISSARYTDGIISTSRGMQGLGYNIKPNGKI